jgi:(2R)-sulfolactate sulfo-lyase subunit alpha
VTETPLIVLAAGDNVAVCRRAVSAGEACRVDGIALILRDHVELGHKIAVRAIARGAAVVKYGMAIGTATADIAPGDWVHLHNLSSNYLSTRTRKGAEHDDR